MTLYLYGSYRISAQEDQSSKPFTPKPLAVGQPGTPFSSRESMLTYECGRRLQERSGLPDEQKYRGFEITKSFKNLIVIITGLWHRYGRNKNQATYDQWLLQRTENLEHCRESTESPSDKTLKIIPARDVRHSLGFRKKGESQKFTIRSVWHRNSTLNGYAYKENREIIQIKDGVTSYKDQTSGKLQMAREIRDGDSGARSIAYTGRPDTLQRAEEQAQLIFEREMEKSLKDRQGLQENQDGTYALTYIVTNLSQDRGEHKAGTMLINGKQVQVKPIYRSTESQNQDQLLKIEMQRKNLNCPIVYHGEGVEEALALSMTAHHYRKGGKALPKANDATFQKLLEINRKALTLS